MLSRADILAAKDRKMEKVPCPEWAKSESPEDVAKAFVFVKGVSGKVRDVWEHSSVQMRLKGRKTDVQTNFANTRTKLLVHAIVDEHSQPLFTEEDIEALGEKSAAPLDRCFEVAQRLSGISAADVEDIVKNSETTPPAPSP